MRLTRVWIAAVLCASLQMVASAYAADPRIEDVAFVAKCDKTEQRYVLIYPEGFKGNQPHHLLVALHGHGSDRWQFARAAIDEAKAARDVAAARRMLFRFARLSQEHLVDGAESGGRPGANHRRVQGPLSDRQGDRLRRIDGRVALRSALPRFTPSGSMASPR